MVYIQVVCVKIEKSGPTLIGGEEQKVYTKYDLTHWFKLRKFQLKCFVFLFVRFFDVELNSVMLLSWQTAVYIFGSFESFL